MEFDEAKKELLSFHNNLLYIKMLKCDVDLEREKAENITSKLSNTSTSKQNFIADKRIDFVINMINLDNKINDMIKENLELIEKVIRKINQLQQPYKNILYMKYISVAKKNNNSKIEYMPLEEIYNLIGNDDIKYITLKQIGYMLGYDKDYIAVLHRQAISQYAKLK